MILNNRKKQERISGLWIVALPRPEGWKDIEDVRLWHGEGCAGGHVLFLWGIENGLCSTRGGNVREICLTEKEDSRLLNQKSG